jgi:hypothetical protein
MYLFLPCHRMYFKAEVMCVYYYILPYFVPKPSHEFFCKISVCDNYIFYKHDKACLASDLAFIGISCIKPTSLKSINPFLFMIAGISVKNHIILQPDSCFIMPRKMVCHALAPFELQPIRLCSNVRTTVEKFGNPLIRD